MLIFYLTIIFRREYSEDHNTFYSLFKFYLFISFKFSSYNLQKQLLFIKYFNINIFYTVHICNSSELFIQVQSCRASSIKYEKTKAPHTMHTTRIQ